MTFVKPLPKERLEEILGHLVPDGRETEPFRVESSWPSPLNALAYQGLAGEIVNIAEPHTESDPVAILVQLLVAFGNIIGRGPHWKVEADHHYSNLYSVIVGKTSRGRKGTSEGIVMSLLSHMSHEYFQKWHPDRVKSGLSSGEGVIYHVRDATENDEGVADKRLFIRETEFGNVLRVLQRTGNTLSPVIRQGWDTGNLAILTKNNPIKATNAHISISGHITAEELRQYLGEVEIFNGLANRFIWVCVKRSKVLPEGGRFHELNTSALRQKIERSIEFARSVGEVKRDDEAREIWRQVYPELSKGRPGLAGVALSRAEAQVMRLALIYALLDMCRSIKKEHLLAALSLWEYAENSVKYIFGDRMGDPVADRIYDALCNNSQGLTRTEIRDLFSRHATRERIDDAIALLLKSNKTIIARTETGGRPVERIKLKSDKSDKSDITPL
jgi:hypothetical protein